MIIKGRSRGNGAQLANYLLNQKDNVRAEWLAGRGSTSDDPRRALLEMSLSSELTGRTKDGLYHMQLSPRAEEAENMTWEEKRRAVEITAEAMGLAGHKWALFEHEKADGRIHQHLVFERYNHDTKKMWSHKDNYAKHEIASRQMEREFGWKFTHQEKNRLDKNLQDHITEIYNLSEDAADFVLKMNTHGFEITQGMDKRPFEIVDQYGTVHNLTGQIAGVRQRDVSKYMNDIRSELRPTAEASHDRRQQHQQQEPAPILEPTQDLRDLDEAQELAEAMRRSRQDGRNDTGDREGKQTELPPVQSYSFKFEQPLTAQQPEPAGQAEPQPDDLSEKQDFAAAMIEHARQREQAQPETVLQQAQESAREQTRPANDDQPRKYFNPVTGQEMTADAYQRMQARIEEQKQREAEKQARDRERGRQHRR